MGGTGGRPGGDRAPLEPPAASVIVPVRDRRDLLADLLSALAAQTCQDFELVVVDDGSSDGSAEVAESTLASGRLGRGGTVLRQGGEGAVAARQAGVAVARGRVLAFTDSDCVPAPGWIEAGVAAVEGGADVVMGPTRSARMRRPLERGLWVDDNGLYPTCNVFYDRHAFEAAGGFDEAAADRYGFRPGRRAKGLGFGEDTLLGWRVRRRGTAAYVESALVHHAVFPPDPVTTSVGPSRRPGSRPWSGRCRSCGPRSCTAASSSGRADLRSTWRCSRWSSGVVGWRSSHSARGCASTGGRS